MTKIKNTEAYPIKQYPVVTDYVIGSDSENDGQTANFSVQSFVSLASGLMDYIFTLSSVPLDAPTGNGYFETNNTDLGLITSMRVSKITLQGQDLTPFITFLSTNLIEFTLFIVSKTDRNIFGYYSITNIVEHTDYFDFTVALATGDNFLGSLIDKDIYTFDYEKVATGLPPDLFTSDIPVVLGGGKTLGKYVNGQIIPSMGKTPQQVITDIALEYINPAFSSFSVTGQATTIEVGTTLSGSKTFTWGISVNSGIVATIDLYDNTANATLLAGTPNDGTQAQTITTILLNADGSTQSWKGIANNTSPIGTINSSNFIVTSRFLRWWSPVASYPVNPADGAGNRTYANALPNNAFKTPGGNTFIMDTGTTQNKFIVLLPPGITIVSVIDLTNANTNITTSFILSAITINDIGGTARNYNMYQYTNAIPYTTSANLSITTT